MFDIATQIERKLKSLPLDAMTCQFQLHCAPDKMILFLNYASHLTGKSVSLVLAERSVHQRLWPYGGGVLQDPFVIISSRVGVAPFDHYVFVLDVDSQHGHALPLKVSLPHEDELLVEKDYFSVGDMSPSDCFVLPFKAWYAQVCRVLGV